MFGLEAHDPKVTSKAAGQKLVFSKMVDDDIICEVCIFKKKPKYPKLIQICLISLLRSLLYTTQCCFSVAVTFRF